LALETSAADVHTVLPLRIDDELLNLSGGFAGDVSDLPAVHTHRHGVAVVWVLWFRDQRRHHLYVVAVHTMASRDRLKSVLVVAGASHLVRCAALKHPDLPGLPKGLAGFANQSTQHRQLLVSCLGVVAQ